MSKRLLVSVLIVLALVSLVGLDVFFSSLSPFKGQLSRALDRLINGSPQDKAVDIADAIQFFDDTCMVGTVYKKPPYSVDHLFLEHGLVQGDDSFFRRPHRPLTAYTLERNQGRGFECFVQFVSFEDIETVMEPAFERFTQNRLRRPMMDNPRAFQFSADGAADENQPTPKATIKSFATTDDIQYFVIFRPSSYSLNHILQLILLPISELGGDENP